MSRNHSSASNYITIAALAALVPAMAGCNADNAQNRNTDLQAHGGLYDPMKDAAPGDELPAAPSISSVTPSQVMGNGNDDIIVPAAANARR